MTSTASGGGWSCTYNPITRIVICTHPGPIAAGFGVPMYYYDQFMRDNGLYARLESLMADPAWADPVFRAEALGSFKAELREAPMRADVVAAMSVEAMRGSDEPFVAAIHAARPLMPVPSTARPAITG